MIFGSIGATNGSALVLRASVMQRRPASAPARASAFFLSAPVSRMASSSEYVLERSPALAAASASALAAAARSSGVVVAVSAARSRDIAWL
jgi:hypothetical protein